MKNENDHPEVEYLKNEQNFDFVTTRQAAKILLRTKSTLERWRRNGIGPKFYRTAQGIYYRESDLAAYFQQQFGVR